MGVAGGQICKRPPSVYFDFDRPTGIPVSLPERRQKRRPAGRRLGQECSFFLFGHTRLIPDSSRYTPKRGLVQIAAFGVANQSAGGSGEEKQQVDPLGRPLVHAQKQRHHQQQKRTASYAPGGNYAGSQAAEKRNDPVRHSRYFTPA